MNKFQLGRPCFYLYMLRNLAQNNIYNPFHKTIVWKTILHPPKYCWMKNEEWWVKGGRSWIKLCMNDELNYMNYHILDLISKKLIHVQWHVLGWLLNVTCDNDKYYIAQIHIQLFTFDFIELWIIDKNVCNTLWESYY
jgi:hypothetical protein